MSRLPRLTSIRVSLLITGFGDNPTDVTQALRVTPTRLGRVGDDVLSPTGAKTRRKVRRPFWSLQSRTPPEVELSEQIRDVINQLGAGLQRLPRLPQGTSATILCTVIPDEYLPVLVLQPQAMRALGEVGISVSIDVLEVDAAEPL